jgi:hypothetical protein
MADAHTLKEPPVSRLIRAAAPVLAAAVLLALAAALPAVPTENLGLRVLPAPGAVTVDGKADDWDLSGGIFICDDPATQRDSYAVWFHAMYDAQNLYLLARFIDPTPMNNPGVTVADYGWEGDCLQVRFITGAGADHERTAHLTAWRGRDGRHLADLVYGKKLDGEKIADIQSRGGRQAFAADADAKGYAQELALPWQLLAADSHTPKAGDTITMTVEPNFTVGASGRLSIKGLFKPGETPDRVFTFQSWRCWGPASLEPRGGVQPQAVRLADAREFAVRMQDGRPVVDWTGLVKTDERPAVRTVTVDVPEDGFVSLNLVNEKGRVVRHLLTAEPLAKGTHAVPWDGLATWSWTKPGAAVAPGRYTARAIFHKGLGLQLAGWAHNAGRVPWSDGSGTGNWGGDHGLPVACAAEGDGVFLGWSGAEAGEAVVATDLDARVRWRNTRSAMTGVSHVAAADGAFFAASKGTTLYRLDARTGDYQTWTGADSPDVVLKSLWPEGDAAPDRAGGLAAGGGRLLVSFTAAGRVAVLDAASGKLLASHAVPAPGHVAIAPKGNAYVVSEGARVLALDPKTGKTDVVVDGLADAVGIALDAKGNLYVSVRGEAQQVRVFSPDGKPLRTIGRAGGRPRLGPWTPDGMLHPAGLAIDRDGRLWVAEEDEFPKRISVWNAETGALMRELFGPTAYGATGGAIDPTDPMRVAGHGCEWQLDPATGRDRCLGVITRGGMANARYGAGPGGRLYLAVTPEWNWKVGPVTFYERVAPGDWKVRARLDYEYVDPDARQKKVARTLYWADENGDAERQDAEVTRTEGEVRISDWYMRVTQDLTLYAADRQYKVAGWTACGAPKYDLANPVKMPAAGFGSGDGRLVLTKPAYGVDHSAAECWDIASGEMRWSYPSTFVGVHGSHRAPPPARGLVRGSFGPCGAVTLPPPVGNAWVIPTNVGEWHILTGDGFYLGRLFQPDPLKVTWPAEAVPGTVMDECPPGAGAEDFGGSVAATAGGALHVQAGKTAFWNLRVTGLDTVRPLPVKADLALADADVRAAQAIHDAALQQTVGTRRVIVRRLTPEFTGDLARDFKGAEVVAYQKQAEAAVRTALAWDDRCLYVGWDVRDATPWQNSAGLPEAMYSRGDTVDLQLAADPAANPKRTEAARGDLRISIGNFKGTPAAVLYRPVWDEKHPKTFSSGVVREYIMDSVTVLEPAALKVRTLKDRTVVEIAVPLEALGLKPTDGLVVRGDVGATHGDAGGEDAVLRTYWNNQHTGIVSDDVFELKLEPRHWGEFVFGP